VSTSLERSQRKPFAQGRHHHRIAGRVDFADILEIAEKLHREAARALEEFFAQGSIAGKEDLRADRQEAQRLEQDRVAFLGRQPAQDGEDGLIGLEAQRKASLMSLRLAAGRARRQPVGDIGDGSAPNPALQAALQRARDHDGARGEISQEPREELVDPHAQGAVGLAVIGRDDGNAQLHRHQQAEEEALEVVGMDEPNVRAGCRDRDGVGAAQIDPPCAGKSQRRQTAPLGFHAELAKVLGSDHCPDQSLERRPGRGR